MGDMAWMALAAVQRIGQKEPFIVEGFGQRAYFNQTNVYPGGVAVFLLALARVFVLKRGYAFAAVVLLLATVPTSQRVVIAGMDWDFGRLIVLAGLARIFLRSEYRGLKLTRLDKLFFSWGLVVLLVYTLRRGSFGAFVLRAGVSIDTVGLYTLARAWIRGPADVDRIGRFVTWLSIPAAFLFLKEWRTGVNGYTFIGGVERTELREGRIRCIGPFEHAILAGAFWVSLLPWIAAGLWTRHSNKLVTLAGCAAIVVIVFCSSSSTPALGFVAVLGAAGLYFVRSLTRPLRWTVAATLLALHIVMNKPVWHLIARVGVVGGSTGYHRFRLLDAAIQHWSDWVLLGTKGTASWGWYLFDVTNQYVKEAIDGGGLGLVLFIWYFSTGFGYVSRLCKQHGPTVAARVRWWSLGVAMFAQCVMFIGIGITHAQQNYMVWVLPIAALSGVWQFRGELSGRPVRRRRSPAPVKPVRLWPEGSRPRLTS